VKKWTVKLISFHNSQLTSDDAYILCLDGVVQSITGENRMLPCLVRYPKLSSEQENNLSFPLARDYFDKLTVYLQGDESLLKRCQQKNQHCSVIIQTCYLPSLRHHD
jgi:hypothetical protein